MPRLSSSPSAPGRVRVWHLEMHAPSSGRAPSAPGNDYRICRVSAPDLDQYRDLYVDVGAPWQWLMRRLLDDARLAEILGHPLNELWHVLEGDRPVGFAELDLRHLPDVELVYFGLIQGCIGTGVGPWFLRSMMDEMWSRPETGRFWLHTCELDHPRALSFYQRCGLRIFKAGSEPAPSPSQQLLW